MITYSVNASSSEVSTLPLWEVAITSSCCLPEGYPGVPRPKPED